MNLDFNWGNRGQRRHTSRQRASTSLAMRWALGHEHQNPLSNIPWNAPAVYTFYAQMGWSQQKVNEQVLNKFQSAPNAAHRLRPSVHHAVPRFGQPDHQRVLRPDEHELSATDKSYIGKIYSNQKIKVRHAANTSYATLSSWLNGIYHTLQPGESLWVPAKTSGNQYSASGSARTTTALGTMAMPHLMATTTKSFHRGVMGT